MKLFLASSLDACIDLFVPRLPKLAKEVRVLFVPNAADMHKDPWWLDLDKKAFEKAGFSVEIIDLRKLSKEEFHKLLEKSDVLHFGGGNVLYLNNLLKEKKFDKIVIDAVRNDKIMYTGTSAGSMIVSPSVKLSVYDPDETAHVKNTKDFSGLDLVNFLIIPHSQNPDFIESNADFVKHLPEESMLPLIFLHDGQAVWVEDDKFKIIKK